MTSERDYPIVGVVQFSVFDLVKYLVKFKGMSIKEAIAEQGLLPDDLKDRIKQEAMKW